jgi:hypothetical protein
MTHLNPFTYLSRGIAVFFLLSWALHRGWVTDNRFESLGFEHLRKFKLRSIVTLLLFISMFIVVLYDIICMKFKYIEGYYCTFDIPLNSTIAKVTPKSRYSEDHLDLVNSANALWSVTCVTKTSAMFLINAMWHNISRKVFQSSFMSSREFKGYVAYSLGSVLLYPIFQYIFLYDSTLTTIAPQFIYSAEVFIIGCLSQHSNYRFRKLTEAGGNVLIDFYTTINNYLTLACMMDVIGLATINIASASLRPLTPFELDVLSHIFNLGFVAEYAILFCIIYPPTAGALPPTRKSRAAPELEMTVTEREKASKSRGSLSQLSGSRPSPDGRFSRPTVKTDSSKSDPPKNDFKHDAIQVD